MGALSRYVFLPFGLGYHRTGTDLVKEMAFGIDSDSKAKLQAMRYRKERKDAISIGDIKSVRFT